MVVYNEENAGTKNYVSEDKVLELIKLLTSGDYRSPSEFLLLFRSCIGLLASDIDEFGELISQDFLNLVQRLIQDLTT